MVMTAPRHGPLQSSLVVGVFPLVAAALFLSLWLYPGEAAWTQNRCGGRPVLLPVVDSAPRVGDTAHDSYITVQSDGSVFLDSKWYPDSEFSAMFQSVARVSLPYPGSRVFLKVDRSLPFERVRSLLRSLRDVGIGDATLIVEPRYQYGPPPSA